VKRDYVVESGNVHLFLGMRALIVLKKETSKKFKDYEKNVMREK
jgi:hypothetical protein